jgi:DNA mismatch endonuclease (patch repair protein)
VDIKSKEARSKNMAAIKSKNTRIEISLRKALWKMGLRFRTTYKLPGRPDIIFTKEKIAIFCDGCFWHHCPKCAKYPEQNREFWFNKINANISRDKRVNEELKNMGWYVLRYWECDLKKNMKRILEEIVQTKNDRRQYFTKKQDKHK